jgi:hypothetical protein
MFQKVQVGEDLMPVNPFKLIGMVIVFLQLRTKLATYFKRQMSILNLEDVYGHGKVVRRETQTVIGGISVGWLVVTGTSVLSMNDLS